MPEPMEIVERCVDLDGTPAEVAVTVDDIPVVVGDSSLLVANPADVAVFEEAGVGEDECVGLISAKFFDDVREIVNVASAAGAVEPEFCKVAIVGGEFIEFGGIVFVIVGGVGKAGFVAIPG